jgi:hypothetical protein
MRRRRRIIVPGLAHHFTQPGNNRGDVFDTDADRLLFLDLLGEYARRERRFRATRVPSDFAAGPGIVGAMSSSKLENAFAISRAGGPFTAPERTAPSPCSSRR